MADTQSRIKFPLVLNVSASGDNLIVPAIPGLRVSLLRYSLKVAGAVTLTWKSSGGTVIGGPMPFASAGDGIIEPATEDAYLSTTTGEGLTLNLSASVAVGGYIQVWYER